MNDIASQKEGPYEGGELDRKICTSMEGEKDTVSYTLTSIYWLPTMCVLEGRRRHDEKKYTVGSLLSIPSVLGG